MGEPLPLFLQGTVVKGFGRGSKELGIPTANFGKEVVRSLPNQLSNGIYFGWAQVDSSPVYKMVVSIGWNPFFKNVERSIETHIMHFFDEDFYDSNLKIIVAGYLRPEKDFSCKDELIDAIKRDISEAEKYLDDEKFTHLKNHSFFNEPDQNSISNSGQGPGSAIDVLNNHKFYDQYHTLKSHMEVFIFKIMELISVATIIYYMIG